MKIITTEQFVEVYKPILNQLKLQDMLAESGDFEKCKIDLDQKSLDYIESIRQTKPEHLWTVVDEDGEIIISSGYRYVNRMNYIVTEIPANGDVQVIEPTVEKRSEILLKFASDNDNEIDESDVDEFLDEVLDDVHDKQYTVSIEREIVIINSLENYLGLEVDEKSQSESTSFKVNLTFKLYEDDQVAAEEMKNIVSAAIHSKLTKSVNDDECLKLLQFTVKVKDVAKPYHGTNCPHCGSDEIKAKGAVEVDGSMAWQKVTCEDCNHQWNDFYKLTGYESI